MGILGQDFVADLLSEGRNLSPAIPGIGIVVGLLLWALGSRGHRFWLVLAVTVCAGLAGLHAAPAMGVQPLVGGLLMAVSAGALSLSLMPIAVFCAVGLASLGLAQVITPGWNEPTVFFLAGGLIGFVFYRVWIMALTSLAGSVLMIFSTLCLMGSVGSIDVLALVKGQTATLEWLGLGTTAVGVVTQFLLERRRAKKKRRAEEKKKARLEDEERYLRLQMEQQSRWWWRSRDNKPSRRRAG